MTPQRQSQFTPKMKANAVPHLLSSLVWIDQYNECHRMTSFMELMILSYCDATKFDCTHCGRQLEQCTQLNMVQYLPFHSIVWHLLVDKHQHIRRPRYPILMANMRQMASGSRARKPHSLERSDRVSMAHSQPIWLLYTHCKHPLLFIGHWRVHKS